MSVTVTQIARAIQDDEILLKNLVLFSAILEIPNSVFRPFLRQYNCDNISVYELIAGVLETWVSLQPLNGATVQELCTKFNAMEFVNLSETIRSLSKDASCLVTTRVDFSSAEAFSTTFSYNVSPRNDHFVGREVELHCLMDLMNTTTFRKPVVISGISGIGKTQLVSAFTTMIKHELVTPPVFGIISMKSEAQYKSSTKSWLQNLNQWHGSDNVSPQTTVRYLMSGLKKAVEKVGWVIVLEDVGDNNVDYKEVVIQLLANDAFVLMTTSKLDSVSEIETENIVLGQIHTNEAEELLQKCLKVPAGDVALESLSLVVPRIPLILNKLIPYIRQKDFEAALHNQKQNGLGFVLDRLLNQSPLQVLDMIDIGDEFRGYEGLLTTLDTLIAHIKFENNVSGEWGYLILEVVSFVDENGLDLDDVHQAVQKLIPFPEHISRTHFLDSIELLTRFRVITVSNTKVFPVKIIQKILKTVMAQSIYGKLNQSTREYFILHSFLAQAIDMRLPALHQFWNHSQQYPKLVAEFPGIPLHLIIKGIYILSDPRLANFALRNIELLTSTLSPNHEATLKLRRHLGIILAHMGEHDKALDAYQKVWPDIKAKYGETFGLTVVTASEIAKEFQETKQYQNALNWYLRLQIWDYKVQRNNPIALCCMQLKRYAEAKALLEEFIANEEATQASRNQYELGIARMNLTTCIAEHQNILRTVQELKDLVSFRLQSLGKDNKDTIEATCQLAEILKKVGEKAEAITTVSDENNHLKDESTVVKTSTKSTPKTRTGRLFSSIRNLGLSGSKRN